MSRTDRLRLDIRDSIVSCPRVLRNTHAGGGPDGGAAFPMAYRAPARCLGISSCPRPACLAPDLRPALRSASDGRQQPGQALEGKAAPARPHAPCGSDGPGLPGPRRTHTIGRHGTLFGAGLWYRVNDRDMIAVIWLCDSSLFDRDQRENTQMRTATSRHEPVARRR